MHHRDGGCRDAIRRISRNTATNGAKPDNWRSCVIFLREMDFMGKPHTLVLRTYHSKNAHWYSTWAGPFTGKLFLLSVRAYSASGISLSEKLFGNYYDRFVEYTRIYSGIENFRNEKLRQEGLVSDVCVCLNSVTVFLNLQTLELVLDAGYNRKNHGWVLRIRAKLNIYAWILI